MTDQEWSPAWKVKRRGYAGAMHVRTDKWSDAMKVVQETAPLSGVEPSELEWDGESDGDFVKACVNGECWAFEAKWFGALPNLKFVVTLKSSGDPNQFKRITDPERLTGLSVHKYKVERTDGSTGPGKKHENCVYFVLDLNHDKFAIPALKAYAIACRSEFPQLAADIANKVHRATGKE